MVMKNSDILQNQGLFSEALFEKMKSINAGISELELYEFRYCLKDMVPGKGWETVQLEATNEIEARFNNREFYDHIQIKPRVAGKIVLDTEIIRLAQMLFVGLVTRAYPADWVTDQFYFDIRGFYFLHRTRYFTDEIKAHFGEAPFRQFEQKQRQFESVQDVGYKAFKQANAEVDQLFMESVKKLVAARGVPITIAIAGPTAAGKTEIVDRLTESFRQAGKPTTSIELDNFLTDRDYREEKGINSEGKEALHLELLKQALLDITRGKRISVPRYDFIAATSSHDLDGRLKPGGELIEIEPAEIIFIEGNFPFLLEEIAPLIGIKVVYLTDDPIRLKRKWKRDIDYRKKYDFNYFRNRYFKEQFIMAEIAYRPQMKLCDMTVDTTGAALWANPEIKRLLGGS
jgi:uridine kinase